MARTLQLQVDFKANGFLRFFVLAANGNRNGIIYAVECHNYPFPRWREKSGFGRQLFATTNRSEYFLRSRERVGKDVTIQHISTGLRGYKAPPAPASLWMKSQNHFLVFPLA